MTDPAFGDLVRVRGPLVLSRYDFNSNGQIPVTLPEGTWGGVIKKEESGEFVVSFWGYGVFWVKNLDDVRIVPPEECPPPNWELHSQAEGWVPPGKKAAL